TWRPGSHERPEPLRVLAYEAEDAAPVPQRAAGEEAPIGKRVPAVGHDRRRHVPALPPGLRRAVAEVDLLAVHREARVEAAELVEHRAPEEQEAAEHPVRLDRPGRALVEVVVRSLPLERPEERAARRTPDERPPDRREPAARGLPRAVR